MPGHLDPPGVRAGGYLVDPPGVGAGYLLVDVVRRWTWFDDWRVSSDATELLFSIACVFI